MGLGQCHCNGEGELSKRVQLAKAKMKSLRCKSEQSMPFETHQTHLARCVLTLHKCEEDRLSDRQEVDTLLEGFKLPDAELVEWTNLLCVTEKCNE